MNHHWIIGLLTVATLFCCPAVEAQFFGGRGVSDRQMPGASASSLPFSQTTRNSWDQQSGNDTGGKKSAFGGLFSRKPRDPGKPAFSLPKINFPKIEFPKFDRPAGGSAKLFERPQWLPKKDPTAPSLFQRMSDSTKNMASRTSQWFKSKSGEVEQQSNSQWDTIRQEMEQIKRETQEQSKSIRPNLRSARSGRLSPNR